MCDARLRPRIRESRGRTATDYANRVCALYRAEDTDLGADPEANEATPRRTLSKRWRELIYRIYEVDPLVCPR
ncbi:MAG TPA: hypothetical protein VLK65_27835, partial [Vicinamibacteria bacterium]|nr:hypothetical protein [Vicinamibacteria bacterium]